MRQADEFHLVTPDIYFWEIYEPSVKCDLSCCAHRIGPDLLFIDPVPLAAPALEEVSSFARPAAIVLTNANHARAATVFRALFGIPIYAHADTAEALEITLDRELDDGELVLDSLTVVTLPGAGTGEIALVGKGVAHVGDALINLQSPGFGALPDKYCDDPGELRRSLGKLLRFDFELLTFAHGLPLNHKARHHLENLLA